MFQILRDWVEIVKAILIALHPIVLLRVEVDVLHTAKHALLIQPACRITVHFLRHRVIHRIVHALLQPEPSAIAFLDFINTVVTQRCRIFIVAEESADAITVVAIQTITRAKPHITVGVAKDTKDFGVRQSFAGVNALESHIRNDCRLCQKNP